MRSKVAEDSGRALLKNVQRLTPEERLQAFLEHCQLVMSLRDAGERRRSRRRPGTSLRVAGLEDLVAMKLFAGGPQDIEDARRALEIAGSSVDGELLERIVGKYGNAATESLNKLLTQGSDR